MPKDLEVNLYKVNFENFTEWSKCWFLGRQNKKSPSRVQSVPKSQVNSAKSRKSSKLNKTPSKVQKNAPKPGNKN